MLTNSVHIAIHDIKNKLNGSNISENLTQAMQLAKDHYLLSDNNTGFRSAIGAVMLFYGEGSKEFKDLEEDMKSINRVSTMLTALQQSFDANITSTQFHNKYNLLHKWNNNE